MILSHGAAILRRVLPEVEMRRRAFKGIAADAAASFISRNNDLHGYWAIGKLHSLAREHSTTKILIELLGRLPEALSEFASIAARYGSMVETQAASKALTIRSCKIEVEFDLPKTQQCLVGETGFICTVTIVDDRGQAWSHDASGCSRPHDPKRELRSSRVRGEVQAR
ncbi:hypothetical protein EJ069_04620 [Mesorhizobium sp. M2A.F.Ca.ET.043.05.1.1]|nr:hypothetical protein EJ069_04620 [Mesorhizobium sp. M2A.F.Ca.ET.043.05.1.1]